MTLSVSRRALLGGGLTAAASLATGSLTTSSLATGSLATGSLRAAVAAKPAPLMFPVDAPWPTVDPEQLGWDVAALDDALEFARSANSTSLVVLHRGRLVSERHASLRQPSRRLARMTVGVTKQGHAIEDVASVQKSIVSFLVGVARQKGLVQLDDPVAKHLGHGWSKATPEQERSITLKHLITMTSGLDTQLKPVAKPGAQWRYNSTAYSKSLTVIAKASGKSENQLTSEWLTTPIGMSDSKWVKRPLALLGGVDANRFGFASTARDLARFGLLMLANGRWNDATILGDRDYLKASTHSSQKLNPAYGYLWWLNGKSFALRAGRRKLDGSLIPTAPSDMYAAMGALGRKCYVVPSHQLVVTRLGDSPRQTFDRELWRRLMKAIGDSTE